MDLASVCNEANARLLDESEPCLEREVAKMPSPVALVGNGPLKAGWGRVIDSHPSVLRVNFCRVSGYSDFCGTKTTHWASAGLLVRVPETLSLLSRCGRAVLSALGAEPEDGRPLLRPDVPPELPALLPMPWQPEKADAMRRLGRTPFFVRDGRCLLPARRFHQAQTTGFKMACLLLTFGKEISVFGINGLAGDYYWGESKAHWRPHLAHAREERDLLAASSRVRFFDAAQAP